MNMKLLMSRLVKSEDYYIYPEIILTSKFCSSLYKPEEPDIPYDPVFRFQPIYIDNISKIHKRWVTDESSYSKIPVAFIYIDDEVHLYVGSPKSSLNSVITHVCRSKTYINLVNWVFTDAYKANWKGQMYKRDLISDVLLHINDIESIEDKNILILVFGSGKLKGLQNSYIAKRIKKNPKRLISTVCNSENSIWK